MKTLLFLLLLFNSLASSATKPEQVRNLFFRIEESRENALSLQQLTQGGKNDGNPWFSAYYAVATANLALYTMMPTAKYSYFVQGRQLLENAIASDPVNPELRFLRLAMQTGTPVFLNYQGQIATDRDFVLSFLEKQPPMGAGEKKFWSQVLVYLRDRSKPDAASRSRIVRLLEAEFLTQK